jgi:hypothetical protein
MSGGLMRRSQWFASLCLLLISAALEISSSAPPVVKASPKADGALLVLQRKELSAAWKYAVQSRIYPEDPDRLFVTTRGAGLAVLNISDRDSGRPVLCAQSLSNHSLEGQDRVGDTLVVVDLDLSGLHVFDLPKAGPGQVHAALAPVGFLQFGLHGALHCRLHAALDGCLYALVTIGHHIHTPNSRLAIVNVTAPDAPVLVADLETAVPCMEGVLVYRGYAFVGGYCDSHSLVVISLEDVTAPRIVRTLHNESYVNMVGALGTSPTTGTALMYQALWTRPGGLAIFDMEDPASPLEISRVVGDNTSMANRVQINRMGYAFLPLEGGLNASGVAAIDIREPRRPALVQTVTLPASRVYCLATGGRFVYVFAIGDPSHDTNMYTFSINPPTRAINKNTI